MSGVVPQRQHTVVDEALAKITHVGIIAAMKWAVEAEREACALKCEELGADWIHGQRVREQACADAIRARGRT